MPPIESLPLGQAPIGAGGWQPIYVGQVGWGQLHAVRHPAAPVRVIAALAGFGIQQAAGNVGPPEGAGVVIAQLVQAAAAAAVTQRFPLRAGHFIERFGLPERRRGFWHKAEYRRALAARTSAIGRPVYMKAAFGIGAWRMPRQTASRT